MNITNLRKHAGTEFVGVSTPFYCNDGKGNFVFHQRSKNCRDEHGTWDPGSGQLDFGQTVEESVLREVKEEYGCVGHIQEQLPAHSIFRVHNGKKTHWVAIPFFILVNPKEVTLVEKDKADALGWFRLSDLPMPLHSGFQHTLRYYKKYFDKYA